ncbi:post-GPI attachment to proteins factor 2 [Drosophila bipectinata]|uniref:post-GPI attachment to proteins factor 2 n=1 Tax=Drosophila bipectinata TaxID=42026 RepID=UPI001C8A12A3|nr:post-GPI attachment to proteins factor 2 [Drosophila bipectinata]
MRHLKNDPVKLLPSSLADLQPKRRLTIYIRRVLGLGLLPVPISVVYVLVMAILTDFEASTYTSCQVLNVLPSSSAAARSQHEVWTMACWTQFPILLASACLQFRLYSRALPRHARSFGCLVTFSLIQGSCSLVLWGSFATVDGDSFLHVVTAISMFTSAAIYMAGSFVCAKYYLRCESRREKFSLWLKSRLVFVYFLAATTMWIWYVLHHQFCLPLAYSLFALGEFVSFECLCLNFWTAYWDYYHVVILYDKRQGFYISDL